MWRSDTITYYDQHAEDYCASTVMRTCRIADVAGFQILDIFLTQNVRQDRAAKKWVNAIAMQNEEDMVRQIDNYRVHTFRQEEGGPCIFVGESDREKDGCEFVYEELRDEYDGKILLKPNAEHIYRYGKDGMIVIGRLVTEAPGGETRGSAPLERILVELEANKILKSLISAGEIPQVIRDMYDKYQVDDARMLRYARRRNKEDIMLEVLGDRIQKV